MTSALVGPATAHAADDDTKTSSDKGADEEAPKAAPKKEAKGDVNEDKDGVRFRGGISAGGGALILSGIGDGGVAGVGGVDGRLGVQIMDLFAIYAQPHLALGASDTAFAGSLGGTLDVDFTFIDHIFVGVGGGGGLVQFGGTVPCGMLHFRAGGYPYVGYGADGVRRKGLMIGADVYVHFGGGAVLPMPMLSIGYEAF